MTDWRLPRLSKNWYYLGRHLLALADGKHSFLAVEEKPTTSIRGFWWLDGKAITFALPMPALFLEMDNSDRLENWYLRPLVQRMQAEAEPFPYEKVSELKGTSLPWVEDQYK